MLCKDASSALTDPKYLGVTGGAVSQAEPRPVLGEEGEESQVLSLSSGAQWSPVDPRTTGRQHRTTPRHCQPKNIRDESDFSYSETGGDNKTSVTI